MHIPDGILPATVSVAGYAATGAITWYTLRKINQQEVPQAGVPKASLLTSAFLVASWIHIPVPPTSVHLVLNGLLGVVLGYYAFPAILIGLFFQAVMFQHGGLTSLGVNATVIGAPALLSHYIFRLRALALHGAARGSRQERLWTGFFGFTAGAVALGASALLFLALLITTIPSHLDVEAERASIYALTLAHVPLMFIEGIFTALVALFLQRVRPELLENP